MLKSKVILTLEVAEQHPEIDFESEGIPFGSEVVFDVYSYVPSPIAEETTEESDDTATTQGGSPDDGGVVGGGTKPPRP